MKQIFESNDQLKTCANHNLWSTKLRHEPDKPEELSA